VLCVELQAEASISPKETVTSFEDYLTNYEKSETGNQQKLKKAINYLRKYYISRNDEKKLAWLSQRIVATSPAKGRNKKLFSCLMGLENLSFKLNNSKPDPVTAAHVRSMIKELNEFRWGNRDLARALSYVAIGRARFLLGEYNLALQSSMVDPQLFQVLDKKFKERNDGESSPLAALLFLIGNCHEELASQTDDNRDKVNFLCKALSAYYRFITAYPNSNLRWDALLKYENCRSKLVELSGISILSLEKLKNNMPGNQNKLPNSIRMLMNTENYSQAIDILNREIKSRQNHSSYPVYALCLAECYALEKKDRECIKILKTVIKDHAEYSKLADGVLRCAGVLRQNKHAAASSETYKLYYENFKNHSGAGIAAFYLADYNLNKLRKIYSKKNKNAADLKKYSLNAIKMFDIAESRAKTKSQKYFIMEGRAETYFLIGEFSHAANDYKQALKMSENKFREQAYTALNLAKSMYYIALKDKPVNKDILRKADIIINKHNLLHWNSSKIPHSITSDAYRWAAKIKDKLQKKFEAAQLLLRLINTHTEATLEEKIEDTTYAATLFFEANYINQASSLLKKLSSFQSVDINDIRFKIGKKLFADGLKNEAYTIFDETLQGKKNVSKGKLIWLLENLYNLKGKDANRGWYIAFKAGRWLDGMTSIRKDKKMLDNIRFKTASTAVKLNNYPTALAIVDMILDKNNSLLWFPAKFLRADIFSTMRKFSKANHELTEIALTASRMGSHGYFIRAKYKISQNMIMVGNKRKAASIIENLLLPLKGENQIKPNSLPFIYQKMIFSAAQFAQNDKKRIQYSALYHKLFPQGKFNRKAILNIK
jgi:tetratricopeptide (TPR) repeat protein